MAELSGEEKGAILLKSLAPAVVDKIMTRLGPARSMRLRALMNSVDPSIDPRTVLAELLDQLKTAARKPADDRPATIPMSAAKPRGEESTYANVVRPAPFTMAPDEDPLKALARLPAERVALVLEGETTRTAAIVLNCLNVDKAGEVFRLLPTPRQTEISLQFSAQSMPGMDILRRMVLALVQKAQRLEDKPAFPEGAARFRKMADMLRLVDKPQRMQVIKDLEEKAPETAAQLKPLLYRFDDVLRIENRSMQKVLKEVDTKSLALSLRDASGPIRDKFLGNLSKRAQESLSEEVELARTAARDEVTQAEATIVEVIQRLDLAGELVMTE